MRPGRAADRDADAGLMSKSRRQDCSANVIISSDFLPIPRFCRRAHERSRLACCRFRGHRVTRSKVWYPARNQGREVARFFRAGDGAMGALETRRDDHYRGIRSNKGPYPEPGLATYDPDQRPTIVTSCGADGACRSLRGVSGFLRWQPRHASGQAEQRRQGRKVWESASCRREPVGIWVAPHQAPPFDLGPPYRSTGCARRQREAIEIRQKLRNLAVFDDIQKCLRVLVPSQFL